MVGRELFVRWLFGALCSSLLWTSLLLPARAQEPAAEQVPAVTEPQPQRPQVPTTPCEGAADGRAVLLSFGEAVEVGLADAVRTDLTAELAGRGIAVCAEGAKPATLLASVRVTPEAGDRVQLVVSDHTTDKEVTRDVSLAHLPDNGRALAIAIAIDELLRASWAELSLAPEADPAPSEPAPAPVIAEPTSAAPVTPAKKANKWLSLQGTYAGLPDRYRALGAQLAFDAVPWRALWIDARLGVAKARDRDVGPGDVSILALTAAATVGACLEAARVAVRSCLGASLSVDTLLMSARAEPGSKARDAVEPLVASAAMFGLIAPLTERLAATASVALGGAVSGVRITDETRTLLALEGLMMTAALGLGVSL